MTGSAAPAIFEDIDFFSSNFLGDPHPTYRRMRDEAPVWRDPRNGFVYVASFALIQEVARQPDVFGNDIARRLMMGDSTVVDPEEVAIARMGVRLVPTLLTTDPPAHTRYRKLVGKAFTFRRVQTMAPYIARVANDLIDGFIGDGACPFKAAFAAPLPMIVIADQLGVPRADMDRFHLWSDALLIRFGGMATREARLEAARRVLDFQRYFLTVFQTKRQKPRRRCHLRPGACRPDRGRRQPQDDRWRADIDHRTAARRRQRDHRQRPDRRALLSPARSRPDGAAEVEP